MLILCIHFEKLATTGDQEVRYNACTIHDTLMDDINLLYLIVLNPIVAQFDRNNKFFQVTHTDPQQPVKEFCGSLRVSLYDSKGYEKAVLPQPWHS